MSVTINEKDLRSLTEVFNYSWEKRGSYIYSMLVSAGFDVEPDQVQNVADSLGIDANDEITIETLCTVASNLPEPVLPSKVMEKSFIPFNKFGDGTITVEDLEYLLTQSASITRDEANYIIEELDPNDIGRIYIDKFYQTLSRKILGA